MLRQFFSEFWTDLPSILKNIGQTIRTFTAWLIAVRLDILIALAIGACTAAVTFSLAERVPDTMLDIELNLWPWFNSDILRVKSTMISLGGDHFRTQVHPLASIIMYPPTKLMLIAGFSERTAMTIYLVAVNLMWSMALYAALRGLTLQRVDAVIFTVFGNATASAIFWMPIVEVYSTASLTVMLTLALGTQIHKGKLPQFMQSVASALSLSMTTTNWMAGWFVTMAGNNYRRFLRITFDALLIVTLIFAVQKMLIVRTLFFVPNVGLEMTYMFHDSALGIPEKLRAFFIYSFAAPFPEFKMHIYDNGLIERYFSFQGASFWKMRWTGLVGLAAALPLLVWGIWTAWRGKTTSRLMGQAILAFIALQCLFHSFWGDETFLYSMNYMPGVILLAAMGALTKARTAVLAAAVLASVLLGLNNFAAFEFSLQEVGTYLAEQAVQ